MRVFTQRFWKDCRGIATSLMEASLVITIAAVLSSVAVIGASDTSDDANTTNSHSEVKLIGLSILSFVQDTGYAPAYVQGRATGPNDPWVTILESEGTEPSDLTKTWPTGEGERDFMRNQLVQNNPKGTGIPYLRIGEISYARFKGWDGPYVSQIPSGDPWGDKYLSNVGMLTSQGATLANLPPGRRPAVYVLSAGANRVIETKYLQAADEFVTGGDDEVFRIQ